MQEVTSPKKASNKSIGIVVVTYGHEKVIKTLLNSINKQKKTGYEVAVIDNHPEHRCLQIANKMAIDFAIAAENNGFAAGCHLGVSCLSKNTDLLLFLNPDAILEPLALDILREADTKKYDA